jgi:outer membrane protein assembly factor BamB
MRSASTRTAVWVACVVLLSAGWAAAQDWPQWRGPNREAKAVGFQVPATWPKELNEKWKVTVGTGDATPALVGDRLYVFSRQGTDEVIRCLDAANGKEIWKDQYEAQPATGASGAHPGPRSSPTVADGKVVTLGVRGVLSCYDAASGKKLWRKDEIQGWPRFFTASSPIVVGGACIAQLGGAKNGAIVAYDATSGDKKWEWAGGSPAYASPVVMSVNGTKLIIAETEGKIVAIGLADGKLAWEAPFAAQRMNYNAATPIIEDQTLIYAGGGRGVTAVKIDKEGNGFVAKELWSNKQNSVQFNTPVLKNGLLFGITDRNEFFCMNAQDGKTLWTAPVGGQMPGAGRGSGARRGGGEAPRAQPPGGRGRGGMRGGMGRGGYGSIVDAGSVLAALTPSDQLIFFQPSDKAFMELARYKVATTPTYAYPILAANRIYIKDHDSVILWTIP